MSFFEMGDTLSLRCMILFTCILNVMDSVLCASYCRYEPKYIYDMIFHTYSCNLNIFRNKMEDMQKIFRL